MSNQIRPTYPIAHVVSASEIVDLNGEERQRVERVEGKEWVHMIDNAGMPTNAKMQVPLSARQQGIKIWFLLFIQVHITHNPLA